MAEINVKANLLVDDFIKQSQKIDSLIKSYNQKRITIQASVQNVGAALESIYSGGAKSQRQFAAEARTATTAIQAQINALTGVDREIKSATESARVWMRTGPQAYRNVAIEAAAAARTAAQAAAQQESAIQKQINALTGVNREFKSAKESASAFRLSGKTAYEEQIDAAAKAEKQANSLNNTLKKVGLTLANMAKIRAFQALEQGLKNALNEMQAVDDQLVTIRKVTGATSEELRSLTSESFSVGSKYGISPSDYLESVSEFSRAGYKDLSDSLGELAVKTQLVGDVTQETATEMLLAIDAAYEYEGNTSRLSQVLDGMNAIDNNYATSIEKMADGMGIMASVAAQAGVSIEELIAAQGTITAATQRSGSESARALRSLFLNIMGDTKTEIEEGVTWSKEEIESLRDALNKYAPEVVAAADATKTLINPMEAIGALAQSFQEGTLTEQNLMEIVSDLGGKLRSNQLLALIQNWDMYNEMLVTIGASAGSADEEISNAMDSWTRKAQILSNTWTEFVANTIDSGWIESLITSVTSLIKWLDNLGNALLIVGGAITAIKSAKIADVFTSVASSVSQFIRNAQSARNVMATLAATFSTTQLAVMGIGAALSAIGIAFSLYESHMNSLREAAQEAAQAAEESLLNAQTLGEDVDKIMELAAAYESAAAGNGNLEYASGQLAEALGLEGEAVDSLSEKYRSLTREKIDSAETLAEDAVRQSALALRKIPIEDYDIDYSGFGQEAFDSAISLYSNNLQTFKKQFYVLGESLQPLENTVDGILNYYNTISETLGQLESTLSPDELAEDEFYQALSNAKSQLQSVVETYTQALSEQKKLQAEQDIYSLLGDRIIQTQEERNAFAQELYQAAQGDSEKQQLYATIFNSMFSSANTNAIAEQTESAGTFGETYAEAMAAATEALQTYKQAQAEVDEQGTISSETRNKLLELDEELSDSMRAQTDEAGELTGRYVILTDALEKGTEAAQENYDAWKDAGDATKDAEDSFESLADSVLNMADDMDRAREAKDRLDQSLEGPEVGDLYGEYRDGVQRLYELLNQGKTGTKEFSGLFSMLFGEDTALSLGYDSTKMRDYAQNSPISALFDEANGEASGLLNTLRGMADEQGRITDESGDWIATLKDQPDGGVFYDIKDPEKLADALGVTTDVITSLIDGLQQYGDSYSYTLEDALNLVKEVDGATQDLGNGKISVDFEKVAKDLLDSGESLESVYKLFQLLGSSDDVVVENAPTNEGLLQMWEDAQKAEDALQDATEAVEGLNNTSVDQSKQGLEGISSAGNQAETAIDGVSGALKETNDTAVSGPSDGMSQIGSAAAKAESQVSDVTSELNRLDGTQAHAVITVTQKFSPATEDASPWRSSADGTKNFPGGTTLINELGPEMIAVDGKAFIAGGGAPAIANIPAGAIIFDAEDTKKLLTTGIASNASGTYYGPTNASSSTSTGSGSRGGGSSGSDNDEESDTPDYWDAIEGYIDFAMDKMQWQMDEIDDKIDDIEKERDNLTDAIEDEIEALDKIQKQIDKQIKAIEKEREEQIAPLQEQLDLLKDQKDTQDELKTLQEKELAVEEARKALMDAQERTVRIFNQGTGQWEWIADASAVKDAEEGLLSAQEDLDDYRSEMELNALQDQIDQIGELYDKQIEELEKQNDSLEEQTEDLNERKDAITEQYESMMEPLQAQKEALQEQYDAFEKQWEAIQLTLSEPAEDVSVALQGLRDTSLPAMSGVISDVTTLLTQLGESLNLSMKGSGLTEPEYSSSSGSTGSQNSSSSGGGSKKTNTKKNTSSKGGSISDILPNLSLGGLAVAGGLIGVTAGLVSSISGKFDEGGIARGKGMMQKLVSEDELVLDPEMTSRVLSPKTTQNFDSFVKNLGIMVGVADKAEERPSIKYPYGQSSSVVNTTTINGVKIGSDMLQRPLSEVLSALNLYAGQ